MQKHVTFPQTRDPKLWDLAVLLFKKSFAGCYVQPENAEQETKDIYNRLQRKLKKRAPENA